jgi:hypothetical protein
MESALEFHNCRTGETACHMRPCLRHATPHHTMLISHHAYATPCHTTPHHAGSQARPEATLEEEVNCFPGQRAHSGISCQLASEHLSLTPETGWLVPRPLHVLCPMKQGLILDRVSSGLQFEKTNGGGAVRSEGPFAWFLCRLSSLTLSLLALRHCVTICQQAVQAYVCCVRWKPLRSEQPVLGRRPHSWGTS